MKAERCDAHCMFSVNHRAAAWLGVLTFSVQFQAAHSGVQSKFNKINTFEELRAVLLSLVFA